MGYGRRAESSRRRRRRRRHLLHCWLLLLQWDCTSSSRLLSCEWANDQTSGGGDWMTGECFPFKRTRHISIVFFKLELPMSATRQYLKDSRRRIKANEREASSGNRSTGRARAPFVYVDEYFFARPQCLPLLLSFLVLDLFFIFLYMKINLLHITIRKKKWLSFARDWWIWSKEQTRATKTNSFALLALSGVGI